MDVLVFDHESRLYPAIPGLVVTADGTTFEAAVPTASRLVIIRLPDVWSRQLVTVLRSVQPDVEVYLLVDDTGAPGPGYNARCNEASALAQQHCASRKVWLTGRTTFPDRLAKILAGPLTPNRQIVRSGEGGTQGWFGDRKRFPGA